MRKMTFFSWEHIESTIICTEELPQEALCSSQAPDREISQEASCSSQSPDGETSSDGPFHAPLALCFPKTKMVSRERPCRSSWFQKFPWLHFNTRYH